MQPPTQTKKKKISFFVAVLGSESKTALRYFVAVQTPSKSKRTICKKNVKKMLLPVLQTETAKRCAWK
jgi:hypothetical protein